MGPIRTEVVWRAVLDLPGVQGAAPLRIVDLGGGTGADAVRLAELGHHVTVVDTSPDALAALRRRADGAGVGELVVECAVDVADADGLQAAGPADLVLAHGLLEHVDDPDAVIAAATRLLAPGGRISVLVAGRPAAVVARATAGDLEAATRLQATTAAAWDRRVDGPRRFVFAEIAELLQRHGWVIEAQVGRRVVSDVVPGAVVDGDTARRAALLDLEQILSRSADFAPLSGGLQTIARLD